MAFIDVTYMWEMAKDSVDRAPKLYVTNATFGNDILRNVIDYFLLSLHLKCV